MPKLNDYDTITRLLTTPARWAIVGLSTNSARPAFRVSRYNRDVLGMQIVPVHPKAETVHGETGYERLADIPGQVDVVDCFVNSTIVGSIVDEAIAIGAKTVWMQLDVVDEAAAQRALDAGLDVVMDLCPQIESIRRHLQP